MSSLVIKFTEQSSDPNNYGKIHANLHVPYTQYSTLVIDSLTTNCCFEVLNKDDYIVLTEVNNGSVTATHIQIEDSYSSLNSSSISTLLNDLLNKAGSEIRTIVDNTNRIVFKSTKAFNIVDCSYRLKDVLGIYDQPLPIASDDNNTIQCLSVGNCLSTSILYLLASIGDSCYVNSDAGYNAKKILMRINNSYSANFPVIPNNAEFSTYALSNDFSNITFELVDARFKPIKLLSPMYLCGTITGDPKAETINTSILLTPELLARAQGNTSENNNANNSA